MDNEAPKYAEWIPEAGGYVANGQVVSRTPQYDANGRLVAVDVSQFTTPSTTKNQPQVANQTINNGVTTANTAGSNIDVNSMATKAGSLVSLNLNTENPNESAISSPATKSPIAGQVILTPEDEVNKEYQDAVARNDIQGQINALTKASRLTGVDYSAEIANLTSQRQQKIQGIDDNYLQRLNEAQQKVNNAKAMYDLSGKETDKEAYLNALAEYNAIQSEQTKWRTAVGYDDAMKSMYQAEIDALDIDYQSTWMRVVNDIGGQLVQMFPQILNFQYDPYNDASLQVAQQYAVSKVKEQMNATGMYYSSMTQNAIAKAVAELVPVYQKMAREEMIENFQLLQSTANFLMGLEETQFNMWKSQIQMKWDAANQKQKEIQNAINNANARGYYTNEEAAKVGVAPGTESQAARERALDKQEQIEAEIRNLQQNKALAEFKDYLDVENYRQKQAIANKYGTPGGTTGGTTKYDGLTPAQWRTQIQGALNEGKDVSEKERELRENSGFSDSQLDYIFGYGRDQETPTENGQNINWSATKLGGTRTTTDIKNEIQQRATNNDLTVSDKLNLLENAVVSGKTWDDVWDAISTAQYDRTGVKYNVYDETLLNSLNGNSQQKLEALDQYYTALAYSAENGENPFDIFYILESTETVAPNVVKSFENAYIKSEMFNDIEFDDKAQSNMNKVDKSIKKIVDNAKYMDKEQITNAYEALLDTVDSASKRFTFDKATLNVNDVLTFWGKDQYDASLNGVGDKAKENAMLYILEDLYNNSLKGYTDKTYVLGKLTSYFKDKATNYKNGYGALKNTDNYYKFSK